MATEHIKKSHNVSLLLYHLVCPAKYRLAVFEKYSRIEETIKNVCLEIEKRYDIHFVEIGADVNHIHFLVQSVPMNRPTDVAKIIKSITAREVFQLIPEVKKDLWGGEFWTKGYYINTVGKSANEKAIVEYVRSQGLKYQQIYRNQLKLFEGNWFNTSSACCEVVY